MPLDVLIVDDSPIIRKILHRLLSKAEAPLGQIHEATDGRQALEKMNGGNIGLVLADINMPNMDGIELLTSVKADENLKSIPVIIITADSGQDRVLQALKLGAAGYILKPFTAEQIRLKLNDIVNSIETVA